MEIFVGGNVLPVETFRRWKCFVGGNFVTWPNFRHFPPTKFSPIRYIENPIDNTAQTISTKVKNAIKENHKKSWINKNQHGFTITHQQQTCDYNEQLTHSWLKRPSTISHTEGFICAIQEQEIRPRAHNR